MSPVVERKEVSSKIERRNTVAQAIPRIDAATLHFSRLSDLSQSTKIVKAFEL